MKNKQRLADAELDIMRVLWKEGRPMRVKEIVNALENRSWKTQTAHVLLKRLEDAGYLSVDKSGYFHLFRAIISEKEYLAGGSELLIRQTGGSVCSMIASLINTDAIGEEELNEITALLEKKRAELQKKG